MEVHKGTVSREGIISDFRSQSLDLRLKILILNQQAMCECCSLLDREQE